RIPYTPLFRSAARRRRRGGRRGARRPRAALGAALPGARSGRPGGRRARAVGAGGAVAVITALVVALLALTAFAYVALPLISPRHADPPPDDTDPVLAGLQEEKTALLRAIAELDVRTDLTAERRERLRQRYETKAAATLKAIDARTAEIESRGRRAAGGA